MSEATCCCGHPRHLHADRESRLQVVPLSMTEADAGEGPDVPEVVVGAGHCTVAGCGCPQFTDAEP